MSLQSSITTLSGIGPKTADRFSALGIETIEDLLLYFPFRYEDLQTKAIDELEDGEKAVISGLVMTPPTVHYYGRKKNRLTFKMKQGEAILAVSFFNQPYLKDKIELGHEVSIFGKWNQLKASITGMRLYQSLEGDRLQPVYNLTKGLSQKSLVKAIKEAISNQEHLLLSETLPETLLKRYRLLNRQEAVLAMHFPKDMTVYHQALRRLKFEELLYFQLKMQSIKIKSKSVSQGLAIAYDQEKLMQEMENLPFTLTKAQSASLSAILDDMYSPYHMNRLLQGDVGSGKTVVASLAMYAAYTAGYQSAIMVPTEILAEQHYISLSSLFPHLSIALLTSGMKAAVKRTALSAISSGQVDIIIGTHALIQDSVVYDNLGLVIIDEQHRFGVNQRRAFRKKGKNPDVLMMTATPIPRTLAITSFADMDVSVIDELPAGRKPIKTRWVKHEQLKTVLSWLQKELEEGAQAYFVSPLIEESENLDLKNAIALFDELKDYFASSHQVALLHGKMKNDEKDQIMQAFKDKAIDVLVSTTVIEVGVNVPNATIMVIMDADRFGLSQLHQLRGRVGRGDKQSYAILVANPKTETGKRRMQIMTETTDGFLLAEEDLKMRGSGEIFGTKQSGLPEFKVANVIDDRPILEEARKVAIQIMSDPEWEKRPQWQPLADYLPEDTILD